jgi:hypothetical protein
MPHEPTNSVKRDTLRNFPQGSSDFSRLATDSESLAAFSAWLTAQLAELEKKFASFRGSSANRASQASEDV